MKGNIEIYQLENEEVQIEVNFEDESVWLNRYQFVVFLIEILNNCKAYKQYFRRGRINQSFNRRKYCDSSNGRE